MKRRTLWLIVIGCFAVLGSVIWYLTSDVRLFSAPNGIGVIEIKGTISGSQDVLKSLKKFRRDSSVRAILVRIDSPGGSVGPSQEIYREIMRTKQSKPVVASLGSVAASGGYYIASAATRIVSNPGTITGSIGVIIYLPNLRELFGKIGYEMVTIKSGKFKDVGNPGREMTPEEREILQGSIDEAHGQFISDVASGRNLQEDKVRELADGRIIVGRLAQQLGLVDELGNFEDAVNAAASLGKIEGEPELLYDKKKRFSLMDILLGGEASEKLSSYLNVSTDFIRYQVPFLD